MAYTVDTPNFSTLTAAGDYSSGQYLAVDITAAASTVTVASVQGQKVIGFLQNAPTSGSVADVMFYGIAKARAGGTVAIGDDLIVDSSGRVITAGNNTGFIVGKAVIGGAVNETISVLIEKRGDRPVHEFNHSLHNLATVANGDVLTTFTPGYRGRVIAVDAVVTNEVTTAAKAATINVEIGTVDITGGSVALTSANTATHGVMVAGSAVTAANTFTATDSISIEAASVTAFSEGGVTIIVKLMQD